MAGTGGPLRLGAIADDLTGATDLAQVLSDAGMDTTVHLGVPGPGDTLDRAATVVALKSRTIAPDEAVAQSLAAARALRAAGAAQILFKYCSTFDSTDAGNIGPVTDALLDLLGATQTLACPALPVNGRTVYQGHLFVGDRLLSESGMRDHPLTPMRDPDLVRVLGRQSRSAVRLIPWSVVAQGDAAIAAALAAAPGIAIVDAIRDADLHAIGRAARGMALVTGGSGVALGLPANFGFAPRTGGVQWPAGSVAPGRRAVLAGSCSEATRAQIARGLAGGMPALRVDPRDIAAGRVTAADAVAFAAAAAPDGPAPLVYSSADPAEVAEVARALGREAAGTLTETFLAEVARGLAQRGFARLLVAGGETSGAVTAALGIRTLDVGPSVAPGVPWMRARGGQDGMAVILKSGNFGGRDIFLSAWDGLP